MSPWSAIQEALDRFYAMVWPGAAALAGVGIVVMALLQAFKDILKLHDRYNRRFLRGWLAQRARAVPAQLQRTVDYTTAHQSLLRLATAGDEDALYALEPPRLVGQISAASQMVIDYSHLHSDLLLCLAAEADPGDLTALLTPIGPAHEPPPEPLRTQWIDSRNRIQHQIQRTLDALLVSLQYRWTYLNQMTALVLNILFVAIALVVLQSAGGTLSGGSIFLYSILLGILSGFVSPVAKDLVTALQQLKSRAR